MEKTVYYIDNSLPDAASQLSLSLSACLENMQKSWQELVILCIGSDRITGDCLGPICGQKLSGLCASRSFIYGTLSHPVHALNLSETLVTILGRHPAGLILAIDASLGAEEHLGYISAGTGPLVPGAGVKKELPAVGDLFITGIVNQSGMFDRFLLQTTRLSTVLRLADTITLGILNCFSSLDRRRYFPSSLWRKKSSFDPALQDLTAFPFL